MKDAVLDYLYEKYNNQLGEITRDMVDLEESPDMTKKEKESSEIVRTLIYKAMVQLQGKLQRNERLEQ